MAQVLDLLPSEVIVFSSEVPARSSLLINRPLQVEVLDDLSWPQVEVSEEDHLQVVVRVSCVKFKQIPSATVP